MRVFPGAPNLEVGQIYNIESSSVLKSSGLNMFKVNNKDTSKTLTDVILVSLLLTLNIFSSTSIYYVLS